MKKYIFFIFSLIASNVFAYDYYGTVSSEWSLLTNNVASQKIELNINPHFKTDLNDTTTLTAIFKIHLDGLDRLEPGNKEQTSYSLLTKRLLIGNQIDVALREFYIDTILGETSIRLGKQQIVWGQADGLKVLDVINPQTFREFILDNFSDSRIPLWTLNAEIPVWDESLLQLLWIMDPSYHDLPEIDSDYAFSSSGLTPIIPSGFFPILNKERKPGKIITDGDYGFRLTSFVKGWDLSFNYLYHYIDAPVLYRTISAPFFTITPKYERTHLIGGTFSNAWGNYTLRGELGYANRSYHITNNLLDNDGIKRAGEFSYVLGLDYAGITDTFISAQFFQSILTKKLNGVTRDKTDNFVTFLFERNFINEIWKFRTLIIHSLNVNDGVLQPKLSYEIKTNIKMWLGADIFYGKNDGLFGQYNRNDRLNLGIEIGF